MADAPNENSVFEEINIQNRTYKYSLRDDIGRGSFGVVFKGVLENNVSQCDHINNFSMTLLVEKTKIVE